MTANITTFMGVPSPSTIPMAEIGTMEVSKIPGETDQQMPEMSFSDMLFSEEANGDTESEATIQLSENTEFQVNIADSEDEIAALTHEDTDTFLELSTKAITESPEGTDEAPSIETRPNSSISEIVLGPDISSNIKDIPDEETQTDTAIGGASLGNLSAANSSAKLIDAATKRNSIRDNSVAGSSVKHAGKLAQDIPLSETADENPATESVRAQASGKTLPQTGNSLPGNLPFYSSTKETPNFRGDFFDFTNKIGMQSSMPSTLTDSQILISQPEPAQVDSTASLETASTSSTLSLDKQLGRSLDALGNEAKTQFSIAETAGSDEWNRQIGSRIRWMGKVDMATAELKLHPAELGTIEIKITTEDDQTKVSFLTNNAAAKEVIESSMPRLKDLLSSGGLQLSQSDVSQRDSSEGSEAQEELKSSRNESEKELPEKNSIFIRPKHSNQIDHYV